MIRLCGVLISWGLETTIFPAMECIELQQRHCVSSFLTTTENVVFVGERNGDAYGNFCYMELDDLLQKKECSCKNNH